MRTPGETKTQRGTTEVRPITDPRSQDLVDLHAVLGECFPEDELLDIRSFRNGLRRKTNPFDIAVAVVDGVVIGGIVGEWYESSQVYLGSYVAVLDAHRAVQVASDLIGWLKGRSADPDRGAVLVIAEVEDPRFYDDAGPHGDPVKRLRLYRKHGARMLDVRYTLPALEEGRAPVPNLRLIAFPVGAPQPEERFVDVEPLRSWFRTYVRRCGGEASWSKERLDELIPELASDKRIPLLDLPVYEDM